MCRIFELIAIELEVLVRCQTPKLKATILKIIGHVHEELDGLWIAKPEEKRLALPLFLVFRVEYQLSDHTKIGGFVVIWALLVPGGGNVEGSEILLFAVTFNAKREVISDPDDVLETLVLDTGLEWEFAASGGVQILGAGYCANHGQKTERVHVLICFYFK